MNIYLSNYSNVTKDEEFLLAVPTTESQREIWNSIAFEPTASLAFNESIVIEFSGKLNLVALKKAISDVIERHSILRTVFSSDGQYQFVRKNSTFDFTHQDISGKTNLHEELCRIQESEVNKEFDLIYGPIIRFHLVTEKTELNYLYITAHHLVCDGWSWTAINTDLGIFYNCNLSGAPADLKPAFQFWQYVQKQREYKTQNENSIRYWKNQFETIPTPLKLPLKGVRPSVRTFESKRIDKIIEQSIVINLKRRSAEWGLSPYQLIYSLYLLSLYEISGQSDLVVGISAAAQSLIGKKDLVGHCVSLLPVRFVIDNNTSFKQHALSVRKVMLDAFENQYCTFGEILKALKLERDISRIPLVSCIFNIDVQPTDQGLNFKDLKTKMSTVPRNFENFELFINLTMTGDQVFLETQYNTSLYTDKNIEFWAIKFKELLEKVSRNKFNHDDLIANQDFLHNDIVFEELKKPTTSLSFNYFPEVGLKLKKIWEELLGAYSENEINDESNFFNLGGHSLIVSDMIVQIQKEFSQKITMKEIFMNAQFGYLAEFISLNYNNEKKENPFSIKVLYHEGIAPLSWQQTRAWYVQKLNPESSLFSLSAMFHIKGSINKSTFKKALDLFLERQLMTRGKLVLLDGMPYWRFLNVSEIQIETEDVNESNSSKLKDDLTHKLDHFSRAAIDIDQDPLFYGKIYFNGSRDVFFYTKIHHLIWDGWSYDIFMSELAVIYGQLLRNEKVSINYHENKITYPDYSLWQEEFKKTNQYNIELNFWKLYLAGDLPILELPFDYPRDVKKYNADGFFLSWNEEEVRLLEVLAQRHGSTLFNLLMTAFKILLSRYTGLEDIIVGTPVRGRHIEGLNSIIGYFVNSVTVRTKVSSEESFVQNLKAVSESLISVFDHSNIPFDEVVKELKVGRDPFQTPVYQAFMMFQDATARNTKIEGLDFTVVPFVRGSSHTDLDLWFRRDAEGMKGGFDFDIHRFKSSTIKRMAEDFRNLLKEISQSPGLPLKNMTWLSREHQELVTNRLNNTKVPLFTHSLLPQLISSQVAENDKKVAITSEGLSYCYSELDKLSNQLANYLLTQGVREGKIVGIAHKRNARLPIILLGILKTGSAYVPLDPDYPQDRLDYMIEHSGIELVLGDDESIHANAFKKLVKINTNVEALFWNTSKKSEPEVALNPKAICYIIYTSGSTGKPKGVAVTHEGVANFLLSMKKTPGFKSTDSLCAITTLNFDIAVLEIYLPLISGGRTHIVPREISMFGETLSLELEKENISILQATPATWKQLLSGKTKHNGIKALCGGEALSLELAQDLLRNFSELWNMYGPTETTVWSTCKKIELNDEKITLGTPIANTEVYILNIHGEVCPVGVVGEIYIGGKGVSKGYYKRNDLTGERFINSAISRGELLYKTGDLGKINTSGELECVGRNDGQVKIRGYRLELGEIEAIVAQSGKVKENVVVAKEYKEGDIRIICYYTNDIDDGQVEGELKKFIREKLPAYMMPSVFYRIEKFPLTLNGKIDKKNLPDIMHATSKTSDAMEIIGHDDIVDKLQKIWVSELGVNEVKLKDDFFDLGGHSLLSIKVFAKIEKEFGIKLPLSSLFHYSVFEKLVNCIREKLSILESDVKLHKDWEPISLTQIRSGKRIESPIYFFHAVGGNTLNYRILLDYIDEDYRIYGLQSPGVNGENKLANSILELAVLYAHEIELSLNGAKTCILIGGSMGGLIAIETARILKEKSIEIEKLIMFDTFGPNLDLSKYAPRHKPLLKRSFDAIFNKTRHLVNRIRQVYYQMKKCPLPHNLRYYFIEINNYKLIHRHIIRPYKEKVYILRMPIDKEGPYADPSLGWKNVLLGEVVFSYIDGVNHVNFVESPVTAYELSKYLKKS